MKKLTNIRLGNLDYTTLAGLVLATLGIVGGLLLEGGKVSDISQLTAALIVLGGTLGAVMVTTPMPVLAAAVKKLPSIFWRPVLSADSLIQQILTLAAKARRQGLVSLDNELDEIENRFFRKALMLAIDGTDLKEVRRIMDMEIIAAERQGEAEAKVFESAGGYAPTIGIIGAVLGLIQVMKHLEDLGAVGHGIAVAFVATVYGVSLANVFLIPAANKLKAHLQSSIQMKELALEGVITIAEGLNPKLIESRLEPFRQTSGKSKTKETYASRIKSRAMAAQGVL
jgi:chemotaxis protein MotA